VFKERYFLFFGRFSWEFCVGDVASEQPNIIAIANSGPRHKVKPVKSPRSRARPSANVNDPGDISDVDLRWNNLGMADRLLEKGVLIVQPV
jgi:hypothetical protein